VTYRTGLATGAWEHAANYVWNDREQFGQKVGTFQGMQFQMAQAWTEIQAARALVYNAARLKEAGKDFVKEAAMAKLYSSQVAGNVSGLAVEWMGGAGYTRDTLAEKYFRDCKSSFRMMRRMVANFLIQLRSERYTKGRRICSSLR
jgi:short/branched chain acyl-CoA dehydrogenase